MFELHMCW